MNMNFCAINFLFSRYIFYYRASMLLNNEKGGKNERKPKGKQEHERFTLLAGGGRYKTFEKVFLEALDEGLSCLGESGKQAVYFRLEKRFAISKCEIPFRVEDFVDALEKIFGPGARLLEVQIMKSLYRKIGKPLGWNEKLQDLVFTEYVTAARRSFKWKEKAESKAGERPRYKL